MIALLKNKLSSGKKMSLLFVYGVLILLLLAAELITSGFLSFQHMETILRQIAYLGIVCIGQNLVIITGGIDLSIRYTLVLCNVVSAQLIAADNANNLYAFLIILLISGIIGLVNGTGTYFLKIPAMIMTLATGYAVYGIAYIYCNGAPKGRTSEFLSMMANGKIAGIINGVILIWIILSIFFVLVMAKTVFGRSVYAIGVNDEAAGYSGIPVPVIYISVYMVSSLLAGIAGYLFLGYTGTSYLSTGESYNMDSIAAVVIGGTSVAGGSGTYLGTIAGVSIMIVLSSFMTVMNIAESGKMMAQGAIVVFLLLCVYKRKKKND